MATLLQFSHSASEAREAEALGDAWLTDQERQRLQGISLPTARQQFIGGHWLARKALAEFAGGSPTDWHLDRDPSGAPLAKRDGGLHVPHLSLSHSAGFLTCAVAATPVGVDVEAPMHPRDLLRLAAVVFHANERAALANLAPLARESYFYCRWTLREAWLKCRRHGLAPARMRTLRPYQVATGADAWTWQAGRVWLALCGTAGMRIELVGADHFQPDAAWRIEEGASVSHHVP